MPPKRSRDVTDIDIAVQEFIKTDVQSLKKLLKYQKDCAVVIKDLMRDPRMDKGVRLEIIGQVNGMVKALEVVTQEHVTAEEILCKVDDSIKVSKPKESQED